MRARKPATARRRGVFQPFHTSLCVFVFGDAQWLLVRFLKPSPYSAFKFSTKRLNWIKYASQFRQAVKS